MVRYSIDVSKLYNSIDLEVEIVKNVSSFPIHALGVCCIYCHFKVGLASSKVGKLKAKGSTPPI